MASTEERRESGVNNKGIVGAGANGGKQEKWKKSGSRQQGEVRSKIAFLLPYESLQAVCMFLQFRKLYIIHRGENKPAHRHKFMMNQASLWFVKNQFMPIPDEPPMNLINCPEVRGGLCSESFHDRSHLSVS